MAYGAPMIAPSATEFELIPISYIPPAWALYLLTRSFRSAISPWAYQYVRLALLSSGGWPAATAARHGHPHDRGVEHQELSTRQRPARFWNHAPILPLTRQPAPIHCEPCRSLFQAPPLVG